MAVALEQEREPLEPFIEGITIPILLDANHLVTELYAVSNIPTVIWIDEDDRIVRPNTAAPGTDTFIDFTGVSCEPHMDAIRRWVRDGEVELAADEVQGAAGELDNDEINARLYYRLALHARRQGDQAAAEALFKTAGELAPHDFTIRRSAMPLTGRDPFGENFFGLWEEWKAGGRKYHGLNIDFKN
ncbi:MAG: thioredoxin family protein [Acidimicrobiales bacterium]|nr:thioredoxin family protein [Acidimicrobiales bacterium]